MSRLLDRLSRDDPGFPRVSGDEPLAEAAGNLNAVFSPRERG